MKINEDWLAVIVAFVLMVLAFVNIITKTWMVF